MSFKKTLTALVTALSLTGMALQPCLAVAQTPVAYKTDKAVTPVLPDAAKGIHFAHEYSDLLPDPKARFGRLPNGMTYIIYKNATPPGTAAIRLRVNAGSLMERDDQQGLAHFLEHMAFNGSKNVPEGEMIKILERHGLKFGPDTNAYTSFDETVYQLDLPTVGEEIVDTSLFLMREAAGNLLLEPSAIDAERDVVLGEERKRDSPRMREFIAMAKLLFDGQKLPKRLPIGSTDVLKTGKRDQFFDFYADFYRPDQVTLVIVGDIDPVAVEAKVVKLFSDYGPARRDPVKPTDFGTYVTKGQKVGSYYETGVPESLSISWIRPLDRHYQTVGQVKGDLIESLAIAAINERFERLGEQETTPFASASFSIQSLPYTGDIIGLDVTPKPGKAKEAFEFAYMVVRQFEAFGITQPELDRALTNLEAGLKASVQGENTRNSARLADTIAGTINDGTVFTSPTQDQALFQALKPAFTLEAVNAAIPGFFSGDGPILWHSGENDGGYNDAALLASYQTVRAANVEAMAARENQAWPYTEFGTASALVERKEIADLGLVVLTYANGVKVTIKSTDFKKDEINVVVTFVGGLSAVPEGVRPPVFAASALGIFDGGLGKMEAADIRDSLTGKIVGANFSVDEDSMNLAGGTTREDFPLQMQVLMAFTTDAAYRPDAFNRLKAFLPNYYKQIPTTPASVFSFNAAGELRSGDPRFVMPSQAEFEATTNDQVKAFIDGQIKSAPVEITIVGDVTEAEARAAVEATFAALPARPALTVKAAPAPKFPSALGTKVYEHNGRADQGLYFMAWPTTDFYADAKKTRGLQLLSGVMNLRLTDEVREKQALAYSPNSGISASMIFADYGYFSASAEVRPDAFDAFDRTVAAIVTDLQTTPIGEDELLRARKPELDRLEIDQKTNGYWVRLLPGSANDPRVLDAIRTRGKILREIDAPYLQSLAKEYLGMDKVVRIIVKPAAAK